jgi:hypothetical protein
VTLFWRAEGAKAVYLHPEGQFWHDHGVLDVGQQEVCPAETTTYCLRAVKPDDSVEVQKRVVQVRARLVIEGSSP